MSEGETAYLWKKGIIDLPLKAPLTESSPFQCLGFNGKIFYFLPDAQAQIIELTPVELNSRQLLLVAPLPYWEKNYGSPGKAPDWSRAADALIQKCIKQGMFDVARVRGRGAWEDEGRILFHTGDYLVIDGKRVELADFKSRFIYVRRIPLEPDKAPPANLAEAAELLELCAKLTWKHSLSAELFAGWCVVAPICGVLPWRSHIWLNGSSGTGKSWILDSIIAPLLGKAAVRAQSPTTEAGIRQMLQSDALPVLLDEAESENQQGQTRMQAIVELARQASSKKGAGVVKGSAGGTATTFYVRSCFAFSSIGVAAIQRADLSRITSLELTGQSGPSRAASFDAIIRAADKSVGKPGFCERIRARALAQAIHIRANASVFARAIAGKLGGEQRVGDQLGTLAAGAYLLRADGSISLSAAQEWVEAQDWKAYWHNAGEKDETQALNVLFAAQIHFNGAIRSITEVIEIARDAASERHYASDARKALQRHGVKLSRDNKNIVVSNSHSEIKRMFKDTPWASKWKDPLGRLPGAQNRESVRFGLATHRSVEIPLPSPE